MTSDEALYERMLGGDIAAFDILYARYERRLFGFILQYLHDQQEAEDVLHEAFLSVLRATEAGYATQSFRAWLFQVTRHLCLNRLRSSRRAARAIEAAAHPPPLSVDYPEHALQARETTEALLQAVARLPQPLAEMYQMRASGMSYDELAETLEVPLGTVKSRMHQMVSRLREEMSR